MTTELIILIVLLLALMFGYKRGLIVQLGSLLAVIIAIVICHLFGDAATSMFYNPAEGGSEVENSMSLFAAALFGRMLLFAVVWAAVWFVARSLKQIIKVVHLGFFDRLGGAVFMLLKCAILLSLLLNIAKVVSPDGSIATSTNSLVTSVTGFAPFLLGFLNH